MNTEEQTPTNTPPQAADTVREQIQAPHEFNVEETLKLKDDLLAAIRNEAQIEAEFASVKSEFKSRAEKAELEKGQILRKLTDGFEMRATRAVVVFNSPEHGRKTFVREETGEMIREESMSHADWQLPMFRNPDGKDATEPEPQPGDEVQAEPYPEGTEFLSTEGEGTKEDLGRVLDVPGAGTTPLAEALDGAAVQTEQPRFSIPNFGLDDWTPGNLMKAARAGQKKAGWPEAAISTMRAQLFAINEVEPMKALLKPFVIEANVPSFDDLMSDARAAFGNIGELKEVFADVLRHYPAKYPGGNHEQNFERFSADVEASLKAEQEN